MPLWDLVVVSGIFLPLPLAAALCSHDPARSAYYLGVWCAITTLGTVVGHHQGVTLRAYLRNL